MNETHQCNLEELKAVMDEEFGTKATWYHQSGKTTPVLGIFSRVNKTMTAKSNGKYSGRLDVDTAAAFFSMLPNSVPGTEGDRLLVDGENYFILHFTPGIFETIIPLKLSQNKEHNWR